MRMKRVIVTGGAGFIGSHLVAELNRRGIDRVTLVDELCTGEKWRNLLGLRFDDLLSPDELLMRLDDGGLIDADAVVHLGACSSTTEPDADYLYRNNTRYTRRLCEWCLDTDTRFVYASSAATYGDGSQGYDDDESQLDTLRPLNMYGLSKHLFDLYAKRHQLLDHIPGVAGLKYFNVYGPNERHKGPMRSMVHKAREQITDTGTVRLFRSDRDEYGDGEQLRDFIYVGDAVDVTLWLMKHPKVNGIYNCGTGTARSWNDLANATFAAMEREPNIEYVDMPDELRGKYQYYTQAEMRKLRAVGYDRPFTSLEDGVRATVAALQTNTP